MEVERPAELTEDCTIEQSTSNTERVSVLSGTQAGIQVPVGVLRSISLSRRDAQRSLISGSEQEHAYGMFLNSYRIDDPSGVQ